MHPTDVDPGVTLAGRYRVAELLAESPGDGGVAQTWRAIDEVLSRSVVVHVLAADDPRAPALLEASRHAATVSDARFIRVLDAMGEDGVAYVVREWVHGRSLATLLADGPLPPRNAGLIVREVAEALAGAHTQGLTHERLDPDCVVVTDAGSIKIVGLATQLALTDGNGDAVVDRDPARADALGLGRLLYAGLTARWPTGPRSGLEAALRAGDGSLLSPRQCLAGIPKALDEITDRILSDQPRHGTPLESPDQVAAALIEAVGITPPEGVLPISGPPPSNSALVGGYELTERFQGGRAASPNGAAPGGVSASERTVPVAPGPPPMGPPRNRPPASGGRPPRPAGARPAPPRGGGGYPGGPPRPPDRPYRQPSGTRWRRTATLLVGVVLFVGLILLGWQLLRGAFQTDNTAGDDTPSASSDPSKEGTPTQTAPAKPYQIAASGDFDPEGNNEENGEDAPRAYDGKADTSWQTQTYYDPLEAQKDGVGMWIDLGSAQDVGNVALTLDGTGTDLELRAAPEAAVEAPESMDAWQEIGKATGAGDTAQIKLDKPVKTRFLLVWFTKLPAEGGDFRGGVAEIVVRR